MPHAEEMPITPGADERIQKAAAEIAENEEHGLNKILSDPRWVKRSLMEGGIKESQTFKDNFREAAQRLSDETGYPVELITAVYDLKWAPEKRH